MAKKKTKKNKTITNKLLRITNITELDRRTVHLVTVVSVTWLKIELLKMVKFFPVTEALGKEEKLCDAALFCEHIPGNRQRFWCGSSGFLEHPSNFST